MVVTLSFFKKQLKIGSNVVVTWPFLRKRLKMGEARFMSSGANGPPNEYARRRIRKVCKRKQELPIIDYELTKVRRSCNNLITS